MEKKGMRNKRRNFRGNVYRVIGTRRAIEVRGVSPSARNTIERREESIRILRDQ